MKSLVVALSLCLSSAACTAQELVVSVDGIRANADIADRVVEVLLQTCPKLDEGKADIIGIEVDMADEYAAHRLARGWTAGIHVAVELADDLVALPQWDERIGVLAGHTLHYDVGGGDEPGMLGSKRVSQLLCDLPISDQGADTFKPVPEFSFLTY